MVPDAQQAAQLIDEAHFYDQLARSVASAAAAFAEQGKLSEARSLRQMARKQRILGLLNRGRAAALLVGVLPAADL